MQTKFSTRIMAYISIFTALMAVCSWISIPGPIPFTLQTMAVFLTAGVLGGKWGSVAVAVYILLGAVGAPVFAGFKGGFGALFGTTGGYILGFLFSALVMWLMERLLGRKTPVLLASMVAGLLVCYLFGTVWFVHLYTGGPMTFWGALGICVFPYVPVDLIKIALALLLTVKLRPHLKLA